MLKSSMTITIAELHSLRCRFAELHSLRCETHVSRTIAEQQRAPSLSAARCVRMNLPQSCHHGKKYMSLSFPLQHRSALLSFACFIYNAVSV